VIRVVLADDHALVRAGLRALLESMEGVVVVGEASNGQEALALIARHRPHVAVLDIAMPGLNGLEVAARVAREAGGPRVVIVSMHATAEYVRQAVLAGAAGYVLKDADQEELHRAVEAAARGQMYLTPAISGQVAETLRQGAGGQGSGAEALTPRLREVLQLVAEGHTTKEIAGKLGIGVKTVETHRAHLMERLGIRDLAGLVRYAIRAGIVTPDR
jgi:DNA-binding NarL/FixJ family response regulator